jgi:hypothetical protein
VKFATLLRSAQRFFLEFLCNHGFALFMYPGSQNICVDRRKFLNFVFLHGKNKERYPTYFLIPIHMVVHFNFLASIRSRNVRRQTTPPLVISTETPPEKLSGVSRVNQEIATLIARKDPVLNNVSKKSKPRSTKQKKGRLEAKMVKAAAKAVSAHAR